MRSTSQLRNELAPCSSPSTGRWQPVLVLWEALSKFHRRCRKRLKWAILRESAQFASPQGNAMRIDQAVNIEDLHRMAKRRLPKIAFDFIEGGLEDERGLETNTSAFHKHRLLPRYLVDVSTRDQTKTIFGQTFSSPFGISPTGGTRLFRDHGDQMLATPARDAKIPYIMSGASNAPIEGAAKIAPKKHWDQLSAARDPPIT